MYRSLTCFFVLFFFSFLRCFQPWFSLEPCIFIVLRSPFSLACIVAQFFLPHSSIVFRVWWKMVCAFPCAQLMSQSPSTGPYSLILLLLCFQHGLSFPFFCQLPECFQCCEIRWKVAVKTPFAAVLGCAGVPLHLCWSFIIPFILSFRRTRILQKF